MYFSHHLTQFVVIHPIHRTSLPVTHLYSEWFASLFLKSKRKENGLTRYHWPEGSKGRSRRFPSCWKSELFKFCPLAEDAKQANILNRLVLHSEIQLLADNCKLWLFLKENCIMKCRARAYRTAFAMLIKSAKSLNSITSTTSDVDRCPVVINSNRKLVECFRLLSAGGSSNSKSLR